MNNVMIGAVGKFPVKLAKQSLEDTIYYIKEGSHFKGFDASQIKNRLSSLMEIDKNLPYSVYGNVLALELANKHKEFSYVKKLLKDNNVGQRSEKGIFELYIK